MESTIKRSVRAIHNESCAWCGNPGRDLKEMGRLFQYGVNDDWRGDSWQDKLFCSKDCMETYYK